MRPRSFEPGDDLKGRCIIFSIYWGLFMARLYMSPHNYCCGDKTWSCRAAMWNTGYPGTQKLGLSAQSHSCSRTHTSWTWCAPLELCYSDGGQGSCKFLRLTCPSYTLTHSESRGSLHPFTLLFTWMWSQLGDKWAGDRKLKGKKGWVRDLPILGSFSAFCSDSFPHPECQNLKGLVHLSAKTLGLDWWSFHDIWMDLQAWRDSGEAWMEHGLDFKGCEYLEAPRVQVSSRHRQMQASLCLTSKAGVLSAFLPPPYSSFCLFIPPAIYFFHLLYPRHTG